MTLKRLHGTPLITNASINRSMAELAYKGGLSVADIAAEWSKVFRLDADGKLSQIYDSEYPDGRKETKYTITRQSVTDAIARRKAD